MRSTDVIHEPSTVAQLALAQEMRVLLEGMNVGIAIYGSNGHLLSANDKFYALHCIDPKDVSIGMPIKEVLVQTVKTKLSNKIDPDSAFGLIMGILEKKGAYRIELLNQRDEKIRISRHLKPNKMIVETVEYLGTDTSLNNFGKSEPLKYAPLLSMNELLDALNSSADGFALYSAEGYLLAYNQSFVTLNPESADIIKIGCRHSDLVASVYDRGKVDVGDMSREEFLQFAENERLKPTGPKTHRNYKGRWVRYSAHRLENGCTAFNITDITELKYHEFRTKNLSEQAAIQEERLHDALSSMSQGIGLYDKDNRMLVFNQQFIDLFGIDASITKAGASRLSLVKSAVKAGKYAPEVGKKILDLYQKSEFGQKESTFLHHFVDGHIMEVHNKPLPNGQTIVVATDVTQRETDARKLAEQSMQFNDALTNMSQGLAMFNEKEELLVWNTQFMEMTGVDRSLVKKGVPRIVLVRSSIAQGNHSEKRSQEAIDMHEKTGFVGGGGESVFLHYPASGRIIEMHNRPAANGYTIATTTDVTQRENDAMRLAKYTQSLERSNAELQNFAYVASHDLQEPLRKIETFGDRLTKKYGHTLPEDGAMYLDRMQNASRRMRLLINDLLSYSRVTSKTRSFNTIDLNEIIEGVLSDIQIRLEDTNGKVEVTGLRKIDGDAVQMRQLFQNLISNALKFQKNGVEPLIRIVGETVMIENSNGQETEFHRIKITDNGIGFDNRFKDQIFAIFKRLHGRMEYEGTGIGLSTCRKIVERHLGTITAHGEEGIGATFTIDIPVKNSGEDE